MGREIKRVALDFSHPIGQVWPGYVNDHYKECAMCKGRGTTNDYEWVDALAQYILLLGGERRDAYYAEHFPLRRSRALPGAQFREFSAGLAGRPSDGLLGHDSIDRWRTTKKLIAAAGLPENWGHCPACAGEGTDPASRAAYEAWAKTEPPSGDGWQMWETVSEGSPVSPVFATAEALADWLVTEGYSPQAARAFVSDGWAPSFVGVPGVGLWDGIRAAGIRTAAENEHSV